MDCLIALGEPPEDYSPLPPARNNDSRFLPLNSDPRVAGLSQYWRLNTWVSIAGPLVDITPGYICSIFLS